MMAGYLFALAATAIWSGNFIIARGLNQSIPPISLAFWRWVVAVAALLPFALKSLIDEWGAIKKNIPYLAVTSLLGVTLFNTFIYVAGHTTTAINISLICLTFPIFMVVLSRFFFQERITINKGVGIMLVAGGVLLLIAKGAVSRLLSISFATGDAWALLAAIIFAVYSILLKKKPKQLSIWALQLSTFILGLFFLFPFFIWEYMTAPSVEFDQTTILSILYLGIFASLSAFILWNKAIATVGPSKSGMIYYTLPLFSGFLAHLFLKEEIGMVHFFSMALIISGILAANYESRKQSAPIPLPITPRPHVRRP